MIRFLIENEFSEIKITETKNCIKFDYVQKGEKYSRIFSVIDDSLRIKDKRELWKWNQATFQRLSIQFQLNLWRDSY